MGRHIVVKNGATGREESVDEDSTVQDLRKQWDLAPDFSIVNDQGERIPENEKIGNYVKEGGSVMPLVEPRYGASAPSSSFFVVGWEPRRIRAEFNNIKKVYGSAVLTSDSLMILIPAISLDGRKFNRSSTRLLISFNKLFQWGGGPAVYVDSDLRIWNKKSGHLDQTLTEREMLQSNYTKLCWYNLPRTGDLVFLLSNTIQFLDKLRD